MRQPARDCSMPYGLFQVLRMQNGQTKVLPWQENDHELVCRIFIGADAVLRSRGGGGLVVVGTQQPRLNDT